MFYINCRRSLNHTNGTKAYAVWSFMNDKGMCVQMNQWGPVREVRTGTGGQVKLKVHRSLSQCQVAVGEQEREKSKVHGSAGDRGAYGMWGDGPTTAHSSVSEFATAVERFVGNSRAKSILSQMGLDTSTLTGDVEVDDLAEEPVLAAVAEPEPEPERGENWGAW